VEEDLIRIVTKYWPQYSSVLALGLFVWKYKRIIELFCPIYLNIKALFTAPLTIQRELKELREIVNANHEVATSWRSQFAKKIIYIEDQLRVNGGSTVKDLSLDTYNLALLAQFRSQQTMNSSNVGMFEADSSGYWTWANVAVYDMLGLDSRQVLGNGWLSAIDPNEERIVHEQWKHTIEENIPYSWDFHVINKRTGIRRKCRSEATTLVSKDKIIKISGTLTFLPPDHP
jgi:PAS domain S-box-containing protein